MNSKQLREMTNSNLNKNELIAEIELAADIIEELAIANMEMTPRGLGLGGAFVQTTEHILFARRGR